MILSRTSQYAVQALIYMATQSSTTPVLNKDVAAQLGAFLPDSSCLYPAPGNLRQPGVGLGFAIKGAK